MLSANTIVRVYIAPKDRYSYENIKALYLILKRRWRTADVLGADEIKVMGNNRRHKYGYRNTFLIKKWKWFEKKKCKLYQNTVGDPYHSFFKDFQDYKLDWWGTSINKSAKNLADKRRHHSIPNTAMFNPSIDFDCMVCMIRFTDRVRLGKKQEQPLKKEDSQLVPFQINLQRHIFLKV